MILKALSLQNFRSYEQSAFNFSPQTTIIVGANTAGKTNIIEAIWLLSTGQSFRTDKDAQMINMKFQIANIKCQVSDEDSYSHSVIPAETGIQTGSRIKSGMTLKIVLACGGLTNNRFVKKFSMNDIPKRLLDFQGKLPAVLFSPEELDIVSGGPSLRRQFLDDTLKQVDNDYRHAKHAYERGLRQRNALLGLAKETGRRNAEQFNYWDELLISNGEIITKKRDEFIDFLNKEEKDIIDCKLVYDKSIISKERLSQYNDAEAGAGITLVGPHRDDILIYFSGNESRYFGSRGQQRLIILQLKILQLKFLEKSLGEKPLLLLDDIFSELDSGHMDLVMKMIHQQQTIMTTTHREFIDDKSLKNFEIIVLGKNS